MSKANNTALGCLMIFLGGIFSLIAIGYLFYAVFFILELSKVHWIAIPCGIIGIGYAACSILAAQPK